MVTALAAAPKTIAISLGSLERSQCNTAPSHSLAQSILLPARNIIADQQPAPLLAQQYYCGPGTCRCCDEYDAATPSVYVALKLQHVSERKTVTQVT